jgi:outer membrane protein assembly factor BamB
VGEGRRNALRKLLLVFAAAVVIVVAAGTAFVLYRKHQSRNVRGSSSVEFVTTQSRPAIAQAKVRWPMFGFDAARRRAPDGMHLRPPFKTLWYVRAHELVEFPPAIAYGHLYFVNRHGVVYAVDVTRPRVVWKLRTRRCAAASPSVSRKLVFVALLNRPPCNKPRRGLDGELVALSAKTGRVRWRRRLAGPSESSPLAAGGMIFVGDWSGHVTAFAARTGRLRWRAATGGKVKGGVALSGRRIFVGSYDSHVYAFAARTGRRIWRAAAQERLGPRGTFYSTPAVAYGRVYIGGTDDKVYSFGATSGKLRWSHGTGSYVYASPAVWRRRVLIGSYDRRFYCFDAATGDVRWRFKANGHISGSAVVLNGVVYFSTLSGRTYALNAATGKQLWTYGRGSYAAVVSDGKRLFLAGFARIYALTQTR